jgi:hypothetical protein
LFRRFVELTREFQHSFLGKRVFRTLCEFQTVFGALPIFSGFECLHGVASYLIQSEPVAVVPHFASVNLAGTSGHGRGDHGTFSDRGRAVAVPELLKHFHAPATVVWATRRIIEGQHRSNRTRSADAQHRRQISEKKRT